MDKKIIDTLVFEYASYQLELERVRLSDSEIERLENASRVCNSELIRLWLTQEQIDNLVADEINKEYWPYFYGD